MFVVGIVQENTNSSVDVMRVEKAPVETYADIGGLDEQIMEIKVVQFTLTSLPGVRRAATDPSRTLRRNRREAPEGRDSVRRARYWQNASGEGGGEQNLGDVPATGGFGADSEVRRRG